MNSFSGQIFDILMRQAGIFFIIKIFIANSLLCYFLVVYLLPYELYVLIKQIQKHFLV